MPHKGACIGGICGIGTGIYIITDFLSIPLHLSGNPNLQAAGMIISVGSLAALIFGIKK